MTPIVFGVVRVLHAYLPLLERSPAPVAGPAAWLYLSSALDIRIGSCFSRYLW
jgi:hypothetical protein